ncbi:MAG: SDR family oxidoreductase [Proteobacteria bacterium]|jgi:3-oxoacyl-[acyl-carrier protein] reductase|nr:SDR family oxidoreductase [Candidatus Fonsibacter ubiquis]NCU75022.1 SDR family oxidoreductase [Candidatus Fonsibacter ubiquis]NCW71038.1 SDR family oxidoreductase [Pseudomonadota bacterium]
MNLINLKNKKVFITGGASGIGLSILENFYKLEADIFTIGTNVENLKTIQNNFPKIKTSNFNLENHQKIEELVKEAKEKLGGLDIVINNAGITKDNLAIRMSDEEWNKVININLTAVFLICKYSIKVMMKQDSGSIINISSIVGHTGNFGQANYSSAKAGIIAMSKSLAKEYAKKNIRVNCISPGFIDTKMTKNINEEFKKKLIENIPMGKLGNGNDIANCAIFLASDLSSYITGETIHVNGGMYMA